MNAALAHRGPDGDGSYDSPTAVLGHRRLAIIDRAGGHQPMANEDETCWIVFNGEIYNHRDLRPILEAKGHRFRTHSDTEVILHAYEEYGPACVERLEGMFAFAIYDARKRELFAARDRLGKKPFFYTVLDGMFHFASELPALAQSPWWKGDLDLTGLEGYLSLGYFIAPQTIFKDVFKLPAGHWLRLRDGHIEVREFWDVTEFDTDHRPTPELLTDIDETLRAAVHDRLESEVPLGAFLSGGIDSGLVVSYMAEKLPGRLVTTSVGFGDREHNELDAAGLVAAHFGSEHHPEVIEPDLETVMDPIIRHLGEPLADSSAIPTWYVSRSARRHVTVALSGDGGDEAFAGYDFRYVPHARDAQIRQWLPRMAMPTIGWLGRRWPRSPGLPRRLKIGNFLETVALDSASAYYADLAFLKPAETRRLMGRDPSGRLDESAVYAAVTDPYRRCPSTNELQKAEYADLKVYLPNDPLVKVDRMSMAHSLEVRCPLLDRRVVELAFRIPAERKQVGSRGKALLRALAQQRLPEGLWRLPKRGFTVPVTDWMATRYAPAVRADLLADDAAIGGAIDRSELSRQMAARPSSSSGHAVWSVWLLERWLRDRQRRHPPAGAGEQRPAWAAPSPR